MKRIFAIALILGAFITLLGLGTWQVQRLAWKQDLIAQAEQRPTLPAEPLEDLVDEYAILPLGPNDDYRQDPREALSYRRASLSGRFIGEPVRVFTTLSDAIGAYEGPGYWLMQGFETGTSVVFVNRGFIPFELPEGVTVHDAPVGEVSFQGLIRPDDPADTFTPSPDYEARLIYRRSVGQLMQAAKLGPALPITIDMPASAVGGLPQAGETKFTFSNRHLEYAITWYGLAACLVGVAWWRRRRA